MRFKWYPYVMPPYVPRLLKLKPRSHLAVLKYRPLTTSELLTTADLILVWRGQNSCGPFNDHSRYTGGLSKICQTADSMVDT